MASAIDSDEPIGLSELVLSGFIRVATHPRVFSPPASIEGALEFAHALLAQPNAVVVSPGGRHWEIFERLCLAAGAKGNLVADAYLAALAGDVATIPLADDGATHRVRVVLGHA